MKAFLGAVAALVVAGCSQQQGTAPASEQGGAQSHERRSSVATPERSARLPDSQAGTEQSQEQAKLSFLKRIRDADPQYNTIERALMNERNELGIILSRNVSMDDIPTLMRSLLKQMAAEFPGENLTVIAYAPTEPPMAIGTGRLDASTREMTYTPAQQQRR
jgi:hypothetical protein